MNRRILVAAAACCFVTLFASCDKYYTCTCNVNNAGVEHTVSKTTDKTTENSAKEFCNQMKAEYTNTANNLSATCHL